MTCDDAGPEPSSECRAGGLFRLGPSLQDLAQPRLGDDRQIDAAELSAPTRAGGALQSCRPWVEVVLASRIVAAEGDMSLVHRPGQLTQDRLLVGGPHPVRQGVGVQQQARCPCSQCGIDDRPHRERLHGRAQFVSLLDPVGEFLPKRWRKLDEGELGRVQQWRLFRCPTAKLWCIGGSLMTGLKPPPLVIVADGALFADAAVRASAD